MALESLEEQDDNCPIRQCTSVFPCLTSVRVPHAQTREASWTVIEAGIALMKHMYEIHLAATCHSMWQNNE